MKVMALNDLHITTTPPQGCREIWLEDIFNMLEEARGIAVEQEVKVTVFTGDFFHRNSLPFRTLHRLIRLIKSWPGEKYGIAGNHDIDASGGFENTPLGILFESGAVEWLKEDVMKFYVEDGQPPSGNFGSAGGPFWTSDDCIRIQWSPANYYDGIDNDPANAGLTRMDDVHWAIKVAHMSLLKPGKEYPDGWSLITYDQVPTEGMDVCLFGHIHNDQGLKTVNDCVFAGLGSIGRVARTDYNQRKPRVLIMDITKTEMTFEKVTLESAATPEDLFYENRDNSVVTDEPMARFARDMEAKLRVEGMSLEEALSEVAGKNVEEPVIKLVKAHLVEAGY